MGLKQVEVTIKGQSPLLMHQYPMVPIEAVLLRADTRC